MLHPADLDLARIAQALDERFPELAPSAPVAVLDHGLGSVVIQTAGAVILRVGRNERSYAGYSLEHRLLPAIAARLPVELPSPTWLIEPCDDFACGAIGYPRIEGRTLSLELFRDIDQGALAAAIARLLVALHRVDITSLPEVPDAGPRERRASDLELHAVTVAALQQHLSPDDHARFDAFWLSYLGDALMMDFDSVLTHGDLWYGNLLIDDDGALTAVLDWEIARIGDPARDFAGLKYFGRPFVEGVLQHYGRHRGVGIGELHARIDKIMVMRELYGVRWALEDRSDRDLPEAIEKLTRAVG